MFNKSGMKIFVRSLLIALIAVAIFFRTIIHFLTEVLWYREVGYLDTYFKILFSKIVLAVPLFVLIFLFLAIYLRFIKRKYLIASGAASNTGTENTKGRKTASRVFFLGVAAASGFLSYAISNAYWMEILKFLNKTSFGIADPLFGKDLSFYMFTFPLMDSVFGLAINILAIVVVLTIAYFIILSIMMPPTKEQEDPITVVDFSQIKTKITGSSWFNIFATTLMVVGALFFVVLGIKYYLDSFRLLYSPRGAVFGAGYTDVNVTIWANRIKSVVSGLIAVLLFVGLKGKNKRRIFTIGVVMLTITTLVSGGVEVAIQNLRVSPNELKLEKPYIQNSIKYTNSAYGLDQIEVRDFKVDQNLTAKDILANSETLSNVSINDERPALEAFNQLQGFRGYYQFHDVDIDRYIIDGEIQQMFLSARELNKDKLDENAQSWVNTKLKYTHGYGIAMAPASKVNRAGQPEMVIKDMPLSTTIPQIRVDRPQIYFGEMTNDYVIIDSAEDEFDYPKGDTNEINEYQGTAGIRLGLFNRIMFAIKYNDLKLLISSGVTSDSKILNNRNVVERIRKIAPFLIFDEDAYAVILDGKIYFVLDGYTTSKYYPYSQPYDQLGNNYIRNSVKAVVDAYDGTVSYYISDPSDPLIQTYNKIFNKMFIPMEEMSPELKAHMRVPRDIFEIKAKMYLTFHATDPNVFYNREDKWAIPTETYQSNETEMRPLYYTFKLPEEEKAEFLLSVPFTPLGKQTLTAFLVARNDGDHYGDLVLYRFPKQKTIIGPQQIEAQISNNDIISRDLSLWNSQGSEVIRGHVLTIPMESSILYIEPLYIRASSTTAIPEVKRIIVAYNSNIVMAESLDLALEKIFGNMEDPDREKDPAPQDPPIGTEMIDPQEAIRRANDLYEKAQEALREGSLSEYERLINELGNILKQFS